MFDKFISKIADAVHGKKIKEFEEAPLSNMNRSSLTFFVREKQGVEGLVLLLKKDEKHEIDREYCDVDFECVRHLKKLVEDVEVYIQERH